MQSAELTLITNAVRYIRIQNEAKLATIEMLVAILQLTTQFT